MNYKLAENISWRDIQGQVLILDPRINQKAHELNPLASSIWLMIAQGMEKDHILNQLVDHYKEQKDDNAIISDANDFIDELVQLKLITHDQ